MSRSADRAIKIGSEPISDHVLSAYPSQASSSIVIPLNQKKLGQIVPQGQSNSNKMSFENDHNNNDIWANIDYQFELQNIDSESNSTDNHASVPHYIKCDFLNNDPKNDINLSASNDPYNYYYNVAKSTSSPFNDNPRKWIHTESQNQYRLDANNRLKAKTSAQISCKNIAKNESTAPIPRIIDDYNKGLARVPFGDEKFKKGPTIFSDSASNNRPHKLKNKTTMSDQTLSIDNNTKPRSDELYPRGKPLDKFYKPHFRPIKSIARPDGEELYFPHLFLKEAAAQKCKANYCDDFEDAYYEEAKRTYLRPPPNRNVKTSNYWGNYNSARQMSVSDWSGPDYVHGCEISVVPIAHAS
ncbi:uncharacterized protein LOC135925519 isoform X2 [Gordionus sp. m RMFG-2023]|uniref:uncharacterized protein LOC135925519 isoform X2 n=1 Tax=Gordionus sp. m RMFG-2023 TaxID=3053472 RepID=UPI0031FD24DF